MLSHATDGPEHPRDVSIVIVTFNAPEQVSACLDSLAGDGAPRRRHEVVVVDNASSAATREILDGWAAARTDALDHQRRVLLLEDRNTGFARACNLGASRSRGRVLLLLNSDAQPLPGALDALVEFLDASPGRGVVGGRTLTPDGRVDPASCFAAPSTWSWFADAVGLSTAFRRNRWLDPESMGAWPRDTVREVEIVAGCLLAAHRRTWEGLDGFDERFVMYGEDADLCRRAREQGYRPAVTPDAAVIHARGSSSGSRLTFCRLLLRGKATYAHRAGPRWKAPLHVALLRLGVGTRAAGSRLVRGRSARRAVAGASETRRRSAGEPEMWRQLWRERGLWSPGWPEPRWDDPGWDPLSGLAPSPPSDGAGPRR